MKRMILVLLVFALGACKSDKNKGEIINKNKIEPSSNEKSILDIEYLNDELEIEISDFRIIDNENNEYELQIIMKSPLLEKYSKNYMFFVHCYYFEGEEVEGRNYLAIGTNRKKIVTDKIVFSRKFSTDVFDFKLIRYGMINTDTKERLFNLKLDSISLYK